MSNSCLVAVDPNLRILLKSCSTKGEADKLAQAYLREYRGKETLIDRVFLARKRKEAGVKKPERKPLLPNKREDTNSILSVQPRAALKSDPGLKSNKASGPVIAPPKPAEPVKPRKPVTPSPQSSPEPANRRSPSPRPVRAITPPPKKVVPKQEVTQDESSSEEDEDTSRREPIVKKAPTTTANKTQGSAKQDSQKELYDYYNKKAQPAERKTKTVVKKGKPNHSAYYAQLTQTKTASKVVKKKKKKKKKKHNGFDNYSSSESEPEGEGEKQNVTHSKQKKVEEESDDSDDSDTTTATSVTATSDNESSDDNDSDAATAVEDKMTTETSEKQSDRVVIKKEPEASSKIAAENVIETANVATVADSSTTETNTKSKAVRWDSEVTSPKPTARKSKKDKRKSKKTTKLESVKEDENEDVANENLVEKEPELLVSAQSADRVKAESPSAEAKIRSTPSPTSKSEVESSRSTPVSHVVEKPALAGPFYPSTLSLQSRKSQREAEAQLHPTDLDSKDELKQQLNAMDKMEELSRQSSVVKPEIQTVPDAVVLAQAPAEDPEPRKSKEKVKSPPAEERRLSPYQVLPDIPTSSDRKKDDKKKPVWPALARLQGKSKDREKSGDSLIVYAKPHKAHKKGGKRERKDFGPYVDVLDKVVDTDLQYIIAKTGARLGVEKPANVAKARMAQMLNQRRTAKLDQKILKRLQKGNGAYKKRIDKFLAS